MEYQYLGIEESEDGLTLWRNSSCGVERLVLCSFSPRWESVYGNIDTPEKLKRFCEQGNSGYHPPVVTRTIPQRASCPGRIYSMASDTHARKITFGAGCIFAVILSAYYTDKGNGYFTYKTAEEVMQACKSMWDCICVIVDIRGAQYDVHNGMLMRDVDAPRIFEEANDKGA